VLGAAEAQVHGVPIEKVHFHEVGAVDSICDIAGACYALELLGIESVHCSPINTGSGTVEADHGTMPVPTPATALLLTGHPGLRARAGDGIDHAHRRGDDGRALGRLWRFPADAHFGAGLRRGHEGFPRNGERAARHRGRGERRARVDGRVSVLEANIDDCTPQVLGFAMERLFEAGALDVTLTPLLMKKQRPGSLLRVIATPETARRWRRSSSRETTTLGLRIYDAERRVQSRELRNRGDSFRPGTHEGRRIRGVARIRRLPRTGAQDGLAIEGDSRRRDIGLEGRRQRKVSCE
jgi:hypothetical protein